MWECICLEAASKLLSEIQEYESCQNFAAELRRCIRDVKKQDYDVENALVTKEKDDGTAFSVTCLNRMLYDAAKSCQALLMCRETAKAATKRLKD